MNQQTAENLMRITEESYQKIASSFSETRNFSWGELDLAIEKYLKNNIKILDLGCGNGRLLISLKKYLENFDYTGVDSCLELIKKASILSSRAISRACLPVGRGSQIISFIHQNILDLKNFSDNSFDCIFMIASFNHIAGKELQERTLLEIKRILKPNGILIMTNWNLWQLRSKKSFWRNKLFTRHSTTFETLTLDTFDTITLWQNQFPLYYHAFTLGELKKLLQKTNLKILENYYVKDGKKVHWWNGKNILTVAQKN